MLERLLQAATITLLLSILAGMSSPRATDMPNSVFHAFSVPLMNLPIKLASTQP